MDPLAQLRPLHLPPPVSAWPPAPGWWLLGLLLLALLGGAAWLGLRRRRAGRYRRQALAELARLRATDPDRYPERVNRLLRRTALAAYPGLPVAGLSGARWGAFLAASAPLSAPQRALAGRLAVDAYRPGAAFDPEPLEALARRWIRRHRRRPSRGEGEPC